MIDVYTDDVGDVRLQEGNEMFPFFLHVDIHQWDRRSYLHAVHVFEAIKKKVYDQGVTTLAAAVPLNDLKNIKFVEIFGFERTEYIEIKPEPDVDSGIWVLNLEEESHGS